MNTLRLASSSDLPRMVAILNQAIASGAANAYTQPFTVEARRAWFGAHTPESYPIYICENEDHLVVGYLSISPYRDRPALARTAEISYYVDYACHAQGIGSALMRFALSDLPRTARRVLLAIVLETNQASLRLLEKFEFEKWGHLPEVAELSGELIGQYYYGRRITP